MKLKLILAAVVACAHVLVVGSILRQPLDLRAAPSAPRFLASSLSFDSTYFNGPGIDFFSVYHAGVNARTALSPYDQRERFGGVTPYYFEFRYLPVVASTLGQAFSFLSPGTAYRAWVILVDVLFWIFAGLVLRRLWRTTPGYVTWLAFVGSTPYFLELHMGQFTFAAMALTAVGLWLAEPQSQAVPGRAKQAGATALVTIAVLLKIFPAAALAAWLRRRALRWPLVATCALVAAAAIPAFVSNPRLLEEFTASNAIALPRPGNFGLMASLTLIAKAAGVTVTIERFTAMVQVSLVAFLGSAAALVLMTRRRALFAESAVLILGQVLASFQVWEHHMNAVIVVGTLMVLAMLEQPVGPDGRIFRRDRICAWVSTACLVLLAAPTPFALFSPDPSTWTYAERLAIQATKSFPTLALFLTGMAWLSFDPDQRLT